jgi:hypothetical protein
MVLCGQRRKGVIEPDARIAADEKRNHRARRGQGVPVRRFWRASLIAGRGVRHRVEKGSRESSGVPGKRNPKIRRPHETMLAIVSKSTYSCCMFESSIDLNEIRSALTDAGHTVVGFATLALKKGNDVRLDVSKKYEAQLNDLRSQALTLAERADETVSEIEDASSPSSTGSPTASRLQQPRLRALSSLRAGRFARRPTKPLSERSPLTR